MNRQSTVFASVWALLALAACGGGGMVDGPPVAAAAAKPTRAAAVTVALEGCVVDHNFVPRAGSVRALLPDGRLAASGHTDARGIFVLRVPPLTSLQLELEAPDPQAMSLLSNRGDFSLGGCFLDMREADVAAGEPILPERVAMPVIRVQPQPVSVALGQPARFSVSAEWTRPLHYQWRRDGIDVAGATGPILVLAETRSADQGEYSVVVGNAFAGIASKGVKLELPR